MTEDPITYGTEAEVIRALDRRHEQLRHPEPNQKEIDAESADLLRATFCFKHGIPLKKYVDGFDCPECEADDVLDINYPVSPHKGMF
jgi:hypothetical protein